MNNKKIAIIELTRSHQECIYSHIKYLSGAQNKISLILNKELEHKISTFPEVSEISFYEIQNKNVKYNSLIKIWFKIITSKFDIVIFNTCQKEVFKLAVFPFPNKIKFFSVLHDLEFFQKGYKKSLLKSWINNYLILNDYLVDFSKRIIDEELSFNSVYLTQYPVIRCSITKSINEIWIVVPGSINFERRDYKIFENLKLPDNLIIIF